MRPGGGKAKGSAFERATGKLLSMWVTDGERTDLFARNVLSGGSFTVRVKKNDSELATPGDLVANNPQAYEFLELFSIECKHHRSLQFEQFLFDWEAKSFLSKTLEQAKAQATLIGCVAWVVAKQDLKPTIVLMERAVGEVVLASVVGRTQRPDHHFLTNGTVCMFTLAGILAKVHWPELRKRMRRFKSERPGKTLS